MSRSHRATRDVRAGDRPDIGDRLDTEDGVVDRQRLQHFRQHLEDLGVDDQLLERRRQAALQPVGALSRTVGPLASGWLVHVVMRRPRLGERRARPA